MLHSALVKHRRGDGALAAIVLLTSAITAAGQPSFRVLGSGSAFGASGDGRTIVGYTEQGCPCSCTCAYVWSSPGTNSTLGGGVLAGNALGVSVDGSVIVGSGLNASFGARWINRVLSPLPVPAPYPGGVVCTGVSGAGERIAGIAVWDRSATYPYGFTGACYWDSDGTYHAIGTDPLVNYAVANGVSRDGTTIVGASLRAPSNFPHAFRFRVGGSVEWLGEAPGVVGSGAYACSASGDVVVGWANNVWGDPMPARWSSADGTMTVLPLGLGDCIIASVRSVSADGAIAVGSVIDAATNTPRAVCWFGDSAAVRVENLLAQNGVDLQGQTLFQASTISDDGTTIAGDGSGAWAATIAGVPASLGACCRGTYCTTTAASDCASANTFFAGVGVACNVVGNDFVPCCRADFNQSGGLSVQDVFDFLNAWFAGDASTYINGPCNSGVQDVFDFLSIWFVGC